MTERYSLTRRGFLVTGAAAGGGLFLGLSASGGKGPIPQAGAHEGHAQGPIDLNARIAIGDDGIVTVTVPRTEMGQGVYTSLPMLAAEELDIDIETIRVEAAGVGSDYINYAMLLPEVEIAEVPDTSGIVKTLMRNLVGPQMTGGSTSVRDAWVTMRLAGATARHMLRQAGAEKMNVGFSETTTESGFVVHEGSDRQISYGDLAAAASQLKPPSHPEFRARSRYRYIGTTVPRFDTPAKVTGTAEFGIDVRLSGMVYAAVRNTPVFGGWVKSFDASAVRSMPGVEDVLEVPGGIAVVADSYWHAKTAVDALPVSFDPGPSASLSSVEIFDSLARALADEDGKNLHEDGDAAAAIARATDLFEAEYRLPYLAHATMEPQNCTARVTSEACDIWIGTQAPDLVRDAARDLTGLPAERINVYVKFLGGGFGRRLELDAVRQAVTVAKAQQGRAVKLIWSREEDIQHDVYRPAALSRFRASLDGQGRPKAVSHRFAAQPMFRQFAKRNTGWMVRTLAGVTGDALEIGEAVHFPYASEDLQVTWVPVNQPVPVGNWRSVSNSYAAFLNEVFLDELTVNAGADPIAYRIALLDAHPRFRAVLDLLRRLSDWGSSLGEGRGRGVAIHKCFETIVGEVAEVSVNGGKLIVDRVVAVVDCGLAINPGIVEQQTESGIVYGLTAAIYGDITIEGGRVDQKNFPDYEMVRMATMPRIETHILESGIMLGGMGEPSVPPIAPALVNAIFDATGVRHRTLPLMHADGLSI